ncbi:hypothetical protein BFJ68_g90 [Fusarium oxysporum]|uniref:Uncharacterized protein n=1 Tax=Fusarium oxysporum TaxID=5507 RepID=A0A420S834_FUSOX|nr:hypothetical protein BFJ68_g90 [Fusarium oxysporum]
MTNSNLSASFTLVRRNEVEELPDHKTTYLILGICSGVWLCIVLTWHIMKLSPEMHAMILPFISIIISFNLALWIIMCYFVRRKRHLPDDEAIELTEIKPNLDRGMLIEIISIYRDGIEIYTRDKSPASQRLYYHPSLQDPEQAHMHLHDAPIPPERSMQDLRRELSAGLRLVQRYHNK